MNKPAILVLNAGSSSIKFGLYACSSKPIQAQQLILKGKITNIGELAVFNAVNAQDINISHVKTREFPSKGSHEALIHFLLSWLDSHHAGYQLIGVGHRVVHGGENFSAATVITANVLQDLKALYSLAPLHQPHNVCAIEAVKNWSGNICQVACFDTAFHRTQLDIAKQFALPYKMSEQGILRYGFHGLSYEYIASQLHNLSEDLYNGKVVVAHLGNGASMCAIEEGKSVATSMGFTALDGLMMGQRCGSLDAGVVLHLLQEQNMTIKQVQDMLYRESGLLGVSGISNNMQQLQESSDVRAKQAIDLFCYRAACELCALLTSLQGLDIIVFTAGIGEHSSLVREKICQHLNWLGVCIDASANTHPDSASQKGLISTHESKVQVFVLPTNEELIIALKTQALIPAYL